jgi:hypothetical protein
MKIIISENQVNKIKSKIHEYVKKYGFEKSRQIFGDKVLFTIGFNNDPMEFLNLYNDLEVVIEPHSVWVWFRNNQGENQILFNKKENTAYVKYFIIWYYLLDKFNLDHYEAEQITKKWLSNSYNLNDINIKRI